jgi:hypothetical protein
MKPETEVGRRRMRKLAARSMRIVPLLCLFFLVSICGCSRGPEKKWVTMEIQATLTTYWVRGDRHPAEGIHYKFGKYKMAEGGERGSIEIIAKTEIYRSQMKMNYSSLPAAYFHPGVNIIYFSKDEYGKWKVDLGVGSV